MRSVNGKMEGRAYQRARLGTKQTERQRGLDKAIERGLGDGWAEHERRYALVAKKRG